MPGARRPQGGVARAVEVIERPTSTMRRKR